MADVASETTYAVFVVCAPGLEATLTAELAEVLDDPELAQRVKARGGGVELRLARSALWRLVLGSRLAEGVRVRLGRFRATHWPQLVEGIERLPSHAYLPVGAGPEVSVTCRKSRLYHSDAVRERVLAALGTRGRSAASPSHAVQLWVRIQRDNVTVSVDAAGKHFYRRGYRTHVGTAPLRETLAAALVRLGGVAGHGDGVSPAAQAVWDPFCGSGTVIIEAALWRAGGWARGVTDRGHYAPAFTRWPSHPATVYQRWLDTAVPPPGQASGDDAARVFIGSDVSAKELAAARHNAGDAGISAQTAALRWVEGDFDDAERDVPPGAAIVTNAPYGVRSGKRLDETFARFGAMLQRRSDLGPVTVLTGYDGFEQATGLRWTRVAEFDNRGLRVWALRLRRGSASG